MGVWGKRSKSDVCVWNECESNLKLNIFVLTHFVYRTFDSENYGKLWHCRVTVSVHCLIIMAAMVRWRNRLSTDKSHTDRTYWYRIVRFSDREMATRAPCTISTRANDCATRDCRRNIAILIMLCCYSINYAAVDLLRVTISCWFYYL